MRLTILTILSLLALATPASASYLHMTDARPAAQKYIARYGLDEALNTSLGSCWHAGPRVVRCGFSISDYDGLSPGSLVAVIALRGDRVYGHVSTGGHRYFLRRL